MKIRDIVKIMIKEADDDLDDPSISDGPPGEDQDVPEDAPSNTQVMLQRFKILTPVLNDVLGTEGDDIENLVSNIDVAVYKPTTFQITLKNGNDFMLKYMPAPVGVNGISKSDFKPKDFFQLLISGKKFNLINRSQFQQSLDYIATALKTGPVTKSGPAATNTGGETGDEQGTAGSNIDDTGGAEGNKAPDDETGS